MSSTDNTSTPHDEGKVRVRIGAAGYRTDVLAGRHTLRADEPTDLGGDDTGPTPYDLLLAALGTCTAMTLRVYADRKQWPLVGVEVDLRHERIHAEDCAGCETEEGKISRLTRVIRLEGDLDDAQRARLLEIADKCPVHRTLTGEIDVVTELDD